MDCPSKMHRCRKRHTNDINGGCQCDPSYKSVHPVVGTASRCDTVQSRTAAARCRGAIQQHIFTTLTYCVIFSQRQGLAVTVPCHQHHLIYNKNEIIAETSEKDVQSEHTIYTMHTQGVTLEFPATNSMYPTFGGLFSVRDPRFVHLSMS